MRRRQLFSRTPRASLQTLKWRLHWYLPNSEKLSLISCQINLTGAVCYNRLQMKIGLICPYNIAKGGGVQEIVSALQAELDRRGHIAKILTPEPRDMPDYHRKDHIIFVGGAA